MVELLLLHGTIVTMDPERTILLDGGVAVDSSRLLAIGPSDDILRRYNARRTINYSNKAILPGLIDVHGHAGHSLLKTIGCDTPSLWMRIVTPVYFHFVTPEFWYVDGLIAALEKVRFGVTCGVSVIGSQPRSDDPTFGNNHARAYATVGIREVIGVGGRTGQPTTLADEPAIINAAQQESLALIQRAGLSSHLHGPGWGKSRLSYDAPIDFPR